MSAYTQVAQAVAQGVATGVVGSGSGGGGGGLTVGSARYVGNAQRLVTPTLAIGGANPDGCTNFEFQLLCLIEGARTEEDRIGMVQFPAGRQAGLYCTNTGLFQLCVGDSNAGQVGGNLAAQPASGIWFFCTFSADAVAGPGGFFTGTAQSLNDVSLPYTTGTHAKGIETSLQGETIAFNGIDFGFTNGVRFAEVRCYNSQRTAPQRAQDITRKVPLGTELFWYRFSDAGGGALGIVDLMGGSLPTNTGGVYVAGPTIP